MLKGRAESELSSGGWCERVCRRQQGAACVLGEPTQGSRRFLAKLAGLEVSPQWSSAHPRPTSPHPHGARGKHSFHTQNSLSPSWMYFSGQLYVI